MMTAHTSKRHHETTHQIDESLESCMTMAAEDSVSTDQLLKRSEGASAGAGGTGVETKEAVLITEDKCVIGVDHPSYRQFLDSQGPMVKGDT